MRGTSTGIASIRAICVPRGLPAGGTIGDLSCVIAPPALSTGFAIGSRCPLNGGALQLAREQLQYPLPRPFRSLVVITQALGEREPVHRAGIALETIRQAGAAKSCVDRGYLGIGNVPI